MKITMNMDARLLAKVMNLSGAKTKTAAVDYALREVERRARMLAALEKGLKIEKTMSGPAFDPGYDVIANRIAEMDSAYGQRSSG